MNKINIEYLFDILVEPLLFTVNRRCNAFVNSFCPLTFECFYCPKSKGNKSD